MRNDCIERLCNIELEGASKCHIHLNILQLQDDQKNICNMCEVFLVLGKVVKYSYDRRLLMVT